MICSLAVTSRGTAQSGWLLPCDPEKRSSILPSGRRKGNCGAVVKTVRESEVTISKKVCREDRQSGMYANRIKSRIKMTKYDLHNKYAARADNFCLGG